MLKFVTGNIFEAKSKILLNPVNIEGYMGKGLAFQFKKKYPFNYEHYVEKCSKKELDVGKPFVYTEEQGKIIINFPTKREWRKDSRIEYITEGLEILYKFMKDKELYSVAIPPLGAGNGGLNWNLVKKEIEKFAERFDEKYEISVYEPSLSEVELSKSHLLLIKGIMRSYENGLKDKLTDIIYQKIFYLSDIILNRDYFKFEKHHKGPFSNLITVLYNQLKINKKFNKKTFAEIEDALQKKYDSEMLKKEEEAINRAIKIVKKVEEEFKAESKEDLEYYIELLATVLYILKEKNELREEEVKKELLLWNKRKELRYANENIENILKVLEKEKFIKKDLFGSYKAN